MTEKDLTLLERLVETNTRNIGDLTRTVAEQGVNIDNLLEAMRASILHQNKIEKLENELKVIKTCSSRRQKVLVALLIAVIGAAITGYLSNPYSLSKNVPVLTPTIISTTVPAPVPLAAPIKP